MAFEDSPICFVGPLPPPVHGFSEINRRVLLALRSQHEVVVFDMAPRTHPLGFLLGWWQFLLALLRRKPKALYLALSGGSRQWVDLAFVLVALLRGVPVFVHHHSFSYLNKRRFSAVVLFRALRRARHIVLCGDMGKQLTKQYGVEPTQLRVLSNAAFLEDIVPPALVDNQPGPLRLGFLSNITAEKGIFEFFTVLRDSAELGLALQGVIAGPVDPAVKESFNAGLAASANVQHVGAVYGAEKEAFFAAIDVLFFPTRYPNEAEPVTILEALGHGVPVIAFARGCIDGMIPATAGVVFPYSEAFVTQTVAALRTLAATPASLSQAREAASSAFLEARQQSRLSLKRLLEELDA